MDKRDFTNEESLYNRLAVSQVKRLYNADNTPNENRRGKSERDDVYEEVLELRNEVRNHPELRDEFKKHFEQLLYDKLTKVAHAFYLNYEGLYKRFKRDGVDDEFMSFS